MDYPKSDPTVGLVGGKFTDGNPGAGVPASRDPSSWANQVTDELLAVIVAANLVPSEGDSTQVLAAIQALITAAFTGSNQSITYGSGFQKLPGGMILQWGVTPATVAANTQYTASFPIAFPNNCLTIVGMFSNTLSPSSFYSFNINSQPPAGSGPAAQYKYSSSGASAAALWIAIGY